MTERRTSEQSEPVDSESAETVDSESVETADSQSVETEPIDRKTGEFSDELSQALDDAAGGHDARGDDTSGDATPTDGVVSEDSTSEGDAYPSRHGGGVDDSGVLTDAPAEPQERGTAPDATEAASTDDEDARAEGERIDDADHADSDDADSDEADSDDPDSEDARAEDEDERREREEQFAREHDPAEHDLEAGDEFRQPGDWTADEHGGPQVQTPDGAVHDPGTPEAEAATEQAGDRAGDDRGAGSPRESTPEEVTDGGHGWGSAAPIEDGSMPLGHPVKAWHDTMTFVLPGEDGYEGSDPHEWFIDAQTAQEAGFRHAHSG